MKLHLQLIHKATYMVEWQSMQRAKVNKRLQPLEQIQLEHGGLITMSQQGHDHHVQA